MTTQTTSKSQDILAKLLATENLNIIRSSVKTAAFDIKSRTLLLPTWKEMTPVIEEMLMLHEVGHALFTGPAEFATVFTDRRHLKDYANVIEDVRIEKKMKIRYPGSRKSFNLGYRELNERGFFLDKKADLSKLILIDRINLYFKVGFDCGVQFNTEEEEFIRKVDMCVTEKDVIDLAQEIFTYSKDSRKNEKQSGNSKSSEDSAPTSDTSDISNDESSMHDQYIEREETETGTEAQPSTSTAEQNYDDLAPVTVDNFAEKLEGYTDDAFVSRYFDTSLRCNQNEVIIGYKRIMNDFNQMFIYSVTQKSNKIAKFKSNSSGIVNYLVKEFEMRKSASALKRAKISKIGQLDSKKLYAYKIKDDLFRQVMTVQDGKKHGMVFLLDWSGSMATYMDETVEQVMNLAMFCQRIQIPYQVFAFTDGYSNSDPSKKVVHGSNDSLIGSVHLLELFSNKMSNVEFNKMISYMLCKPYASHSSISGYKLNGTPLNEALLYMVDYLGKFIRDNNVEKTTFITLTDGEGAALLKSATNTVSNGINYGYDENNQNKKMNVNSYFRDPITKKEYPLSRDSNTQTTTILNIIRDRHNAKSVAFFITADTQAAVSSFVRTNMATSNVSANTDLIASIHSSLRKDKCCVIKTAPGRDEMYVLSSTAKIKDEDVVTINEDMSASSIARVLTTSMNSRKTSRIVLNKFIGMVA